MKLNNIEMTILVKNRAISEYFHRGQTFIEGRAGSKYEIEVRNNNPFRVEAIISVDGLSILDGKQAGNASSGYLIEANSSIRIPGWKVDSATAAAFEFAGKQNSYATESTGSSVNNGVIGIMAFSEKKKNNYIYYPTMLYNGHPIGIVAQGAMSPSGGGSYGALRGMTKGIAASAVSASASIYGSGSGISSTLSSAQNTVNASDFQMVEQNLGTGFGEATQFNTSEVSFDRGDLVSQFVLYYDDIRSLKARGVVIPKKKKAVPALPDAFPANQTGCVPPKNWRR